MKRVLKKHYTEHIVGDILFSASKRRKSNTIRLVRRSLKNSRISNDEFTEFFPPFISGNDAVLQYSPALSENESYEFYANSSVHGPENPFFERYSGSKSGGYIGLPRISKFTTFPTNRNRDIKMGTPRVFDTEYKLLEELASKIDEEQHGKINLFTFYEPCLSCDYVLIQFVNMFKNISIDVYYVEEYKVTSKGLI